MQPETDWSLNVCIFLVDVQKQTPTVVVLVLDLVNVMLIFVLFYYHTVLVTIISIGYTFFRFTYPPFPPNPSHAPPNHTRDR